MMIVNKRKPGVFLYEIKHSGKQAKEQGRHLSSKEFLAHVEERFGRVKERAVIYMGHSDETDGIRYINAEEYLARLCSSHRKEKHCLQEESRMGSFIEGI